MSPYLIFLEQLPEEDCAAGLEVFRIGGVDALSLWADILVDIEVAKGDKAAADRARLLRDACHESAKADAVFDLAVASGRLSDDKSSPVYAGNFMFMGHGNDGRALFKHIDTREYLK